MKTAIYLRVSTGDQTCDPQRIELREYCERRGWLACEYSDTISGAKFSRTGLDAMMGDVRKGRIARVVCVKLDRLGRSLSHLAQLIGEMDAHKVALVCTSQGIDTTDGNPAGRLQMHVLMAVAEFERDLIRERTNSGLAAAKARGSKFGRPAWVATDEHQAAFDAWQERKLAGGKATIKELADALGVSIGKAHALVKEAI
jgi:DNA invertase Pin-like site-specific DNA recombinase